MFLRCYFKYLKDFSQYCVTVCGDTNNIYVQWMMQASPPEPDLDCCKIMAPVCLHSSVIRGCVLNQPSGICQHNTVCTRSCWCELRSPMWMEGLPHICWVRWPEDMQSDLSHYLFFFFLLLFSSFSSPSWECRKVGLEERKDWKLLDMDYTECCCTSWREEGISR